MSYTAAETGRVKSIKSKFENLNNLESLDISATVPNKYRKPSPQFLFKRSSTSIDLPINRIAIANSKNAKNDGFPVKTSPHENGIKSFLRRHNNLDRTTSADDTFAVKKRSLFGNDEDTLKPLKEIKENVEVRLTRQNNDPVKRSSIKRSPAFRVGDKSSTSTNTNISNNNNSTNHISNSNNNNNQTNHNNNCKNSSKNLNNSKTKVNSPSATLTTKETVVASNNFAEKFDDFLKRCDIETRQELQEPGLTDTLKAFLKQPLPSGPPPKKPPRTFTDSPKQVQNHQNDRSPHINQTNTSTNSITKRRQQNSPSSNPSPTNDMKNKIDMLENQLVFKINNNSKAKTTRCTSTTKEKSPFSSSLLNCIPCSSASVYDTMTIGQHNQFGKGITLKETQTPEKIPPTQKNALASVASVAQLTNQRQSTMHSHSGHSEPIYMEPFAHLKHNTKMVNGTTNIPYNNANKQTCNSSFGASPPTPNQHFSNEPKLLSSTLSNGSFDGPESLGSSLTSCTSCTADDHSLTDLHDIHYMCTSIEQKIKSSDSDSNSNETDHPITLSKTYDEINILVNAAFGQHKTNDGMGNSDSLQISPSAPHPSMIHESTTAASVNQQKTIKLSRTLTEKRKDYVRRVSAVKQIPDANDSMHQTFKPSVFRTFSVDNEDDETNHNESIDISSCVSPTKSGSSTSNDNTTIDRNGNDMNQRSNIEHTDIDDIDGARSDRESMSYDENVDDGPKLFQVCLLIGFNNSTRQAYIKSKFPSNEDVPPNIEQLVFPAPKMVTTQSRTNQEYSIILTDNNGYHIYGYCRRILPESCEICLPLAYCIISEVKAPGFYFKILKEIETRHGQAEFQTNFLLQSLQNRTIPAAGKFLHVKLPLSPRPKTISTTTTYKITPKRLSLEVNPKWLTESAAQAAFSSCENSTDSVSIKKDGRNSSNSKSLVQEFEEKKQLNNAPFDLSLINRSLFNGKTNAKCDEIFIRRPNDLRLESTELSDLYQALGPDLLIIVFSSLLLERNVIIYSENISILSSCILGLQTLLYPFQWQYTIVTILPENLVDICQSPTPVLAGLLEPIKFDIEDGIVIDLNTRSLVQKCGDETTILPSSLHHSLKVSLEMVDLLDQGKMLSSVLIAEAFLRCFVELFVGYKHKYFDKKLFIESHSSQSYRFFLEWFIETAMFRHFIHQKFTQKDTSSNVDSWMMETKFYDLFDSRILKSENESSSTQQQNMEMIMKNCKVINKKANKTFKDRFKDFISSNSSNNSN